MNHEDRTVFVLELCIYKSVASRKTYLIMSGARVSGKVKHE